MLPSGPEHGARRRADVDACRTALADGSRTFFAASLVLPRRVREPASVLYAFCRLADDEVDLRGGRAAAIAGLRRRLELAYGGRPLDRAVDRALADVVATFAVPPALPEALLEGLAWDAERRRYADLSGLFAYAARVAGSVGAMMAALMGVREADVLARACDLGVAMQLSNIARDVGEDARTGQIYLPLNWLHEAGLDPDAWLAAPCPGEALAAVVRRLLEVADLLYRRADAGIARLPLACRPGIHAARLLYAEIGREVARGGCDPVTRRAVVPPGRKATLLAQALAAAVMPYPRLSAPGLAETAFLVEAVTAAALPRAVRGAAAPVPWWNLAERIGRALEMLEQVERRRSLGRSLGQSGPVAVAGAREDST